MSARRRPVIALMYGGQTRPSWDGPGQQLLIGAQGRGPGGHSGPGTDRDDRRDLPACPAAGVNEHGLDAYDQLLPRYPTAPPWCPAPPPRYSSGHPQALGVS
jgi:hypothetical protein